MADYAISNVVRRVVYTNTGVGPYAFTFEVLANTDIAVYRGSTLLTLTTDYTVIINANGTGSVTLVVAGTGNITIVGARAIQRTSDYTTGGDLFASTLNTDLDSQTIYAQQVAETAERGLKAPVIDPTDINMTLPAKASRVGTVLAFNATTGNPEAGPSIASVATVAAQSANINTVATNIASVNTVAGISANVTTVAGVSGNVTTVAGSISNVNTVADDLNEGVSEINTVAVNIADVNTVGTNIANVNTVAGISANVTSVAGNSSNINTVAGISGNVTTVAGISANVTTVAGIDSDVTAVAADATDIGAVASNIANVNTVAGNSTNINTVAGISANVTTVAGISSNVTTVATNNANVTTVAGISSNVTTVAGISANVTIAATNVADINNFADVYQGAKATDPSLRNDGSALQSGDLYFNTTDDVMKVREAGAWLAAFASLSGALLAANNLSDLTNKTTARQNLDLEIGVDVQAYDAQLADVAGLSPADNNFIVGNGTNFVAESGSTARTSLGLGSIATQDSSNVTVTGGSINGATVGGSTAAAGKFTTLSATGVTTVSAGTNSAPAITTTGDTNTGIFFPAADTIGLTVGGVESARVVSGLLSIPANATAASAVRLYEDTDNGTNYVDVIAPSAITSNRTLTIPDETGTIITTGSSGQSIPKAALPTGSVLQVVQTVKTDTFTTTSSSFTDITGLSVSITPTSASNKILVIYSVMTGASSTQGPNIRLVRNSTAIAIGDVAGSRTQTTSNSFATGTNFVVDMQNMNFLDSPTTTSATTYKLQIQSDNSSTQSVNRNVRDDNASYEPRGVSTITVMEIAA
jgi:hypothetical protein